MQLKMKNNLNEMSLKLECHSKWNVTQHELSLKLDVRQNEVYPKMECH